MNTGETRTKGRTAFSGSVKSVLIRGLLSFRLFGATLEQAGPRSQIESRFQRWPFLFHEAWGVAPGLR